MKKLVLTSIATLAVAVGAYAQGIINLNNNSTSFGVTTGGNNYYSGTFGLEVWELSPVPTGTTLNNDLAGVNSATSAGAAYAAFKTEGFKSEGVLAGLTMSGGGFSLGNFTMADAPAGGSVVLGLAMWNSSAATWAAAAASGTALGGAIAFVNPTVANASPPPVGADINAGWTTAGQNLSMTALTITSTPEPGTLALAGLGVAALLIFRRRK